MTRVNLLALAFALAATACARFEDVAPGTIVTCSANADCPAGRICNRDRCILPSDLGNPPDLVLVDGKLAVSPAAGRAGTAFTVTVEATKELEAPPRVILSLDTLVELPCTATAARTYACAYTATGAERGGLGGHVTIDVRMVDLVGQEAVKNGVGGFDLDFTPPVLAARSVAPERVPLGAVLQVFFTTGEDLGPSPVLVASRALDEPGGDGRHFTLTRQPGTRNYLFTHAVTVADAAGPVTFTADATDLVGNAATGLAVGTVTIDNVVPAISAVAATPARLGATGSLTVTFGSTEEAAPGTLAVTVGGRAMTCGAFSATAPSYTCTRAMVGDEVAAGTEAAQSIGVSLADAAGNRASASGSAVLFDLRAPALAGATADPANVPLGGVIIVSLTPDEDLGASPVLVASRALDAPGGGTRFPLAPQPGTRNYLFTHLVTTGDTSGPVTFTAELTDLVGNSATGVPVGGVTLDTVPPVLAAVQVSPARIDPTGVVTVTFDATEAGSVVVTVGGRAMACGGRSGTSPNHTCTRTMAGDEIAAGTEVPQAVVVALTDLAGNRATAGGTIVFDFRPPGVAAASLAYAPADGSVLSTVARATTGARVTATLLADEALDPAVAPSLVARTISFTYLRASSTSTSAVFQAQVPAGVPDGDYVATVTWVDVAGNRAATSTSVPRVRIKTSAPSLVVDQNALTFVRSPQGNASAETIGSYVIPAGPYFAVEPADALTTSATLPAGSLRLADSGALASVIVQSPSAAPVTLGVLRPDASGRIPRQALLSPDVTAAQLVGVDDAGNCSTAIKLLHAEWVATSNRPVGVSAHRVSALPDATAARVVPAGAATATGTEDTGLDGASLVARGSIRWAFRDPGLNETPPGRASMGLAYDAARGRTVMFGGYAYGRDADIGDTWEWDGRSWHELTPPPGVGPAAQSGPAMAHDSARGVTVLFGAGAETWEWDGASWRFVVPAGVSPPASSRARMVFDASTGRSVMFDGLAARTWEWDGSAWWDVTPAGTTPTARYDYGMAYDPARTVTYLYGGFGGGRLDDMWEWDSRTKTWRNVTPAGLRPPGRDGLVMTYDAARAKTVMLGGYTADPKAIWLWDGASWTSTTPAGNAPAFGPYAGFAYDAANANALLFGGMRSSSSDFSQTQLWDGTSWATISTGITGPTWRDEFAMAYDSLRHKTVLFGGRYFRPGGISDSRMGDTWEWNGSAWVDRTPASGGPTPRWGHMMAYDSYRGRTVLFGGTTSTGAAQDTWEWDGVSWTTLTPVNMPDARRYGAMAYDAARRRTVLFGGYGAATLLGDTWEWNGASWFGPLSSSNPPPSARDFHAMAYDPPRGILLFGGNDGVDRQDTWSWSGTTWAQRSPTGTLPAARSRHALALDDARNPGRVLLSGGTAATGTFVDLWEWNGSTWTGITPAGVGPSARNGPALVYDRRRGVAVMYGGRGTEDSVVWEIDTSPARIPAVQLQATCAAAGFRVGDIQGIRARAWAGGVSGGGTPGAALYAWGGQGSGSAYPGWVALASNSVGLGAVAPASYLGWTPATAAAARRFVTERDGVLSLQVRPLGSAGVTTSGAAVGLDYLEVRVKYDPP